MRIHITWHSWPHQQYSERIMIWSTGTSIYWCVCPSSAIWLKIDWSSISICHTAYFPFVSIHTHSTQPWAGRPDCPGEVSSAYYTHTHTQWLLNWLEMTLKRLSTCEFYQLLAQEYPWHSLELNSNRKMKRKIRKNCCVHLPDQNQIDIIRTRRPLSLYSDKQVHMWWMGECELTIHLEPWTLCHWYEIHVWTPLMDTIPISFIRLKHDVIFFFLLFWSYSMVN